MKKTLLLLLTSLSVIVCHANDYYDFYMGLNGKIGSIVDKEYIKDVSSDSLKFNTIIEYSFDKLGRVIKDTKSNAAERLYFVKEYTYDDKHNETLFHYYYLDDRNRVTDEEFKRLERISGDTLFMVSYKGETPDIQKSVTEIRTGKFARQIIYNPSDSSTTVLECKLTDDALKVKEFTIESEVYELVHKIINEFEGNLLVKSIDQSSYLDTGEVYARIESTYTYPEYDARGNWIKQLKFQDGKCVQIIERTIHYTE